jgi:hypothetical protein
MERFWMLETKIIRYKKERYMAVYIEPLYELSISPKSSEIGSKIKLYENLTIAGKQG